jgi:hypothetical protein
MVDKSEKDMEIRKKVTPHLSPFSQGIRSLFAIGEINPET